MTTTPSAATPSPEDTTPSRSSLWVIALCFVSIVFDGFDLVVYGAVVPDMLANADWDLTASQAGRIGSYALVGMLIGALTVGYATDLIGRRKVMIASVTFFSVLMVATALAPSPELFGFFRFLAGLGLGGVIPTAIALTVEYSRQSQRNFNNAAMFCGYAVGGVLAAISALAFLEHIGFRGMMALGGLPLIVTVPLLVRFLPESPAFLEARGRHEEAAALRTAYGLERERFQSASDEAVPQVVTGGERLRVLVRGRWGIALALFSLAGIAGQTLVYGLNTWLPQFMVIAGYSVKSSLTFLLCVNAGAVVGVIASSILADRFGPRIVTAASFAASGLALLVMALGVAPLGGMLALVAVVGFGSIGAQILVNGFVATYYPTASRASALGVSLGLGRLGAIFAINAGGWLVDAGTSDFVNFSVWSFAAAVGLVAILTIPHPSRMEDGNSSPTRISARSA